MLWACVAKKDDDWVKKYMEYEVEGPGPTVRLKRTWRERLCNRTVKHVN